MIHDLRHTIYAVLVLATSSVSAQSLPPLPPVVVKAPRTNAVNVASATFVVPPPAPRVFTVTASPAAGFQSSPDLKSWNEFGPCVASSIQVTNAPGLQYIRGVAKTQCSWDVDTNGATFTVLEWTDNPGDGYLTVQVGTNTTAFLQNLSGATNHYCCYKTYPSGYISGMSNHADAQSVQPVLQIK
jgi:hypothetical protein